MQELLYSIINYFANSANKNIFCYLNTRTNFLQIISAIQTETE